MAVDCKINLTDNVTTDKIKLQRSRFFSKNEERCHGSGYGWSDADQNVHPCAACNGRRCTLYAERLNDAEASFVDRIIEPDRDKLYGRYPPFDELSPSFFSPPGWRTP